MRDGWFRGGMTDATGTQRFLLERFRVGSKYYERKVLWILSHPRTGCLNCDEPVTRRLMGWCDGFALRSLAVVGLFDEVAPSPRAFVGRAALHRSNWAESLKTQVFAARHVIAAWGDIPPELAPRAEALDIAA